ncbi:transcript variant X7 [Nothobranchius furzeri]|uniref:Transcript variant X7 n=1 Tax=Nothobranchius furzeri TaxID=105023 RepID=A0A9D3BVF7_NOTFU|nr:transcript variant X7 [Nothobranchius furzeri]
MPVTLDVPEDCVVSAIRVEAKFSDEEESLARDSLRPSGQNRMSNVVSLGVGTPSPGEVKETNRETGKDQEKSWSHDESGDEDNKNTEGHSALITNSKHVLARVGTVHADVLTDGDDFEGSDKKVWKGEKRRSSWGSSLEGSDTDLPREGETLQLETGIKGAASRVSKTTSLPNEEHPHLFTSWHEHKTTPTADESKWDSSENDDDVGSRVNCEVKTIPENPTKEEHECSWEEDQGSIEKESHNPSPVVSALLEDDDGAGSVAQLSQIDDKPESEIEKEDSDWDVEDESDESENQKRKETSVFSKVTSSSPLVVDKKGTGNGNADESDDGEAVPRSIIDDDYENMADGRHESSDDSDSKHQKHTEATVGKLDDGAFLTSYVPLEKQSPLVTETRDNLNEEHSRRSTLSSPPTKNDDMFSDEALPQTDIDHVDVNSPDEDENTGVGQHGPGVEKEESTDNEDYSDEEQDQVKEDEEEEDVSDVNNQSEGGEESTSPAPEGEDSQEKKRDFLSELGLEEGEDQDSFDSESNSENENVPHKDNQHEELSPTEATLGEHMFYIPSFLRGGEGSRMAEIEPYKCVGWPQSSQREAANISKDPDDKGDAPQKEKTKWETLSVLNKPKENFDSKKDFMEELGLGDVDDLEDASDWDSASTTSKRTLPGRRTVSPGLEELRHDSKLCNKDQEGDAVPASTPPRSLGSDNTPSKPAPQPQPQARTMLLQKAESEEKSDWDADEVTSPDDNQLKPLAEPPAAAEPGSHELSLRAEDSDGSSEFDEQQQMVGKETLNTAMKNQKSSASLDGGGTTVEEVDAEKPDPGSGFVLSRSGGIHRTNRDPALSHLPVQLSCSSRKQEKQGVSEPLQLEVVRGARLGRAPQTSTHANGDPLSVFDDSSLSDVSDDDQRLTHAGQQKIKNPEDVDVAEEFDELTQSSDTATDDLDSLMSGYRHASLLVQKLDSVNFDSTSITKLQNIFHEYERSNQKLRSRHRYLSDKVGQLEMERAELKNSLEEVKDLKSLLEQSQLELQTEITNLKFQLKQEQENRHNANMMYNTTRDKLRRTEEQQQLEIQDRQKVELALRNQELEMRTLISNMKQLEEVHSETQRLLAQERSARTLQESLLSSHVRKQQEMQTENKRSLSRSNEALSQLTEASERERELLQQTAALQEQLSTLRADLERSQANSSLKESHLSEENEVLKEQLEDVRRDLKISNETVTQTVFSCNNQLSAMKSELALTTSRLENERQTREALQSELESTRSRLAGAVKEAELRLAAHSDSEKALLREKEEHQRLKDRLSGEVANQREAASSLSQKLAKAEARSNSMENEVHRVTLQLTEKALLLEVLQREKDQAATRVKELESALQAERELVSRAGARHEATQERLAQAQSEAMLLRQQLEEAQNKGVAKERAVTDAQERFSDILSQLRSDSEERVQLVEDRNKELASKAVDLRDQIYKLEEEKNDRETSLRQLQQELADSLKKLSMSEASLEVNTRYRNDLEEEKTRLLRDSDRLKGKLEESEDQYLQAERTISTLKSSLDEREKELSIAAQKLQGVLSTSAASEVTIKQLEEAVQKLEIENARLEAAAKQQSNRIDSLQKGAQEAAMLTGCSPGGGVRGHLEELVTNLQSSKMTLEEQLSREAQKRSVLSHTAQDSHALWEEELKSRSKLGLRLAELEKEKGELTTQIEIEKKRAKRISEQRKAIDARLDQEMTRNAELQKEMYRLRTLLKTAKKKLRDQEAGGAEFGSPVSSLRMDRRSQAEGTFGQIKDKVDDLQVQLEKETLRCSQLEKTNDELKIQIASMRSSSHNSDHLERSKRHLEEEVLDLRRRLEATQVEQSQVEQFRREAEERARQEIQQKLEQVNLFLQSQAASQEALDQIKAANEASLRSQLEQKIGELEGELGRARATHQDSLNQRDSTRTELERYRQLYTDEVHLRKSQAAKLERAKSRLAEANSKLLSERSRSLITSSIANGSLMGPPLDLTSLGSAANYGATIGSLNRNFGLGLSLLGPVTEGQSSRVEDYLTKMRNELDRSISRELSTATAELDAASVRMSLGGTASRVEMDPLSRATQEYLEVLKKNNRI